MSSTQDKPIDADSLQQHFKPYRSAPLWSLMQRAMALGALAVLSPLFVVLYVVTKCGSRGPFFFKQQRPGLMGRIFTMYKIRTMTLGSEGATALGVRPSDPTVTPVGRVLRYLKIDELPQLWNVVVGDMEIVGPRPLPIPLEENIQGFLPQFMMRHIVPPGLMNPAQFVESDIVPEDHLQEEWRLRFRQELDCIERKSFLYDLRVIVAAVFYIGARFLGVARFLSGPEVTQGANPTPSPAPGEPGFVERRKIHVQLPPELERRHGRVAAGSRGTRDRRRVRSAATTAS